MDMTEANALRVAFLDPLQRELVRQSPAGLSWKRDAYYGCPQVRLQAQGQAEEARVEVVWEDPAWHSRYRPWPSTDRPHYQLSTILLNDYGTGHAEEREPVISADVTVILEALLRWRDTPPPPPAPRTAPPLGEADWECLRALARARQATVPLVVEEDARTTVDWTAAMERRIARNFPRQDDGRLPLDRAVLLTPFGAPPTSDAVRSLWRVALSPAKRRDVPAITVGLRWRIGANEPHRWDVAPWLWDPQAVPPMEDNTERAARCLSLQDAGRFGEAFALCGVGADEDVWRTLAGQPPHPRYQDVVADWAAVLRRAFWACDPGRLAALWDAPTPRRPARFRLFALPRQTQARKVSLMLRNDQGRPVFALDGTASNARLAEVLWQRPQERDLRRLGLWNGDCDDDA